MIRKEDCYKIGRLGKAHGVKGEVSFLFTDDVFDRADADYLIIDVDGILVPFFMEEYRFRSDSVALVKFCDVDTQQRASELTNSDVWFPRSLTPEEDAAPSLSFLVGFDIVEAESGAIVGRIADIDDSTANLLFCLDDGRLIPANDDLITDIDAEQKKITMNIPEGLLDI
ncbi:MAG: 16S rRNA processing protein RimM [Prevotella sp.]|nr:16S rRNA processing protein RimM [Prevotella sp.]MBQ8657498.1 16S rRNA processing protein RimM [Prevotella sp.]